MPIYTQEFTDDDIPPQQQQQRERSNSISPTTSMADLCLYSELKHSTGEQSEPLKEPSNEIQQPTPTHHKKVASIDSLAYTISAESDSTLPTQNLKPNHRQVDNTDSLSLTYTNTSSEEDEVFQKVDYLTSSEQDEEEEEDVTTEFDQMMNRGAYLRQLRMLALADEEERRLAAASSISTQHCQSIDCEEEKKEVDSIIEELQEDQIQTLPNNKRLLNYNSYLKHQRYYDDLKHADIHYIDYGNIYNSKGENGGRLVVEQCKSLGKGGLCWDAAYCLAEFVIDREDDWSTQTMQNVESSEGEEERKPKIVDLGAGTGLCGLMLAKATNSHVDITEVPELEELMADNIKRNFGVVESSSPDDEMITGRDGKAKGTISSRVLRWGIEEDYAGAPYDVIVGADIVTSLYDPVALAQTLFDLSHSNTRIYISGKSRLDKPHEIFNSEMNRLFEKVKKVTEVNSKLRSPGVFVICAEGRR